MKFTTIQYLSERYEAPCVDCGRPFRGINAKRCEACVIVHGLYRKHGAGRNAAVNAVRRAIKYDGLQRPDEFACVDCANPASVYEHRDYNKPLDVVPVCRSCNGKRGHAIPLKMTFAEFIALVCKDKLAARYELTYEDFEPIRRKYFKESA